MWYLMVCGLLVFGCTTSMCRAENEEDGQDDDSYARIFEEIDVDSVLSNDRLLDSYVHCFLNKAPCSELAAEIKDKIPEILSTVCGTCTTKQKGIFKHSLEVFIPRRPDDWRAVLDMYDPNHEYEPKILDFIKNWKP